MAAANIFVADFMGNPAMNFIPAKATRNGAGTKIEIQRDSDAPVILVDEHNHDLPEDVIVGVRPEDIAEPNFGATQAAQEISCMVDIVEPAGADTFVVMTLGGKQVNARLHAQTSATAGQALNLAFEISKVSYLSPQTGERLN